MATVTALPKILYMTGLDDSGEYGNARCPHCGAEGRYTYHFVTVDGQHLGAMAGCLKLFPKHRFAAIHARILEKEKDNRKTGRNLASWDVEQLDAIEKFGRGEITEWQASDRISAADRQKKAWMQRRGYRR